MKKLIFIILIISNLFAFDPVIYIQPKVGFGFQSAGVVNPYLSSSSITGGFIGAGTSNYAAGVNLLKSTIDQYNYATILSIDLLINYNNFIFSISPLSYMDYRRSSVVPDCSIYEDYEYIHSDYDYIYCGNHLLNESFNTGNAYKIGIGYKITFSDKLSINPSYETSIGKGISKYWLSGMEGKPRSQVSGFILQLGYRLSNAK